MRIIDMHCDTILRCMLNNESLADKGGHINVEKLQQGGCLAQCFALFIPTHQAAEHDGITTEAYYTYKALLDEYRRALAECSDVLRPALSAEDILKNRDDGFISAILTVEDAVPVDGRMERIEEFYSDGVRIMTLTWNYENCMGFPNSKDPGLHAKGLKPFGIEAVRRMNELGMIVDVSHLSEGGFFDVAKYSEKPFVATHSCCRALCSHQRNLTDAQLHTLADCGGLVGINFCGPFLVDDAKEIDTDAIVRHAQHIYNEAGIEALAWGSDFDGIESEYNYLLFEEILQKMSGVFTEGQMDKINSENFLRVFSGK